MKHLGNMVSWNLSEEEEIKKKTGEFIGRTNCLIGTFKGVPREVVTTVFRSNCMHLYGSQAWNQNSKHLLKFDTVWRKGIRKLWYLPPNTRTALIPGLAGGETVSTQASKRQSKMFRTIQDGSNTRINLLAEVSEGSQSSDQESRARVIDSNIKARVSVIKELTSCLEGESEVEGFSSSELGELINYVAVY